jgi:hypothetical protein
VSELDLDALLYDTATSAYTEGSVHRSTSDLACSCGHHHDDDDGNDPNWHPARPPQHLVEPATTRRERREAGPFTGKHEHQSLMLVPPDWNLTPHEYRALARLDKPTDAMKGSLALAAIGGTGFSGALAAPGVYLDGNVLVFVGGTIAAVASIVGFLGASLSAPDYVKQRRHDRSTLGHRDPAEAIGPIEMPSEVYEVLLRLADVPDTGREVHERRERLSLAYEYARGFRDALKGTDGTLHTLVQRCPEQVSDLLSLVLQDGTLANVKAAAHTLNLHWTVYRSENPTVSAPVSPMQSPSRDVKPSLKAQWDAAIAIHDRVVDAWTNIVTDPLAALDHSLLLDVTQPRTAAFIDAYGHAQDLRAVSGSVYPTGTAEAVQRAVTDYLSAVRRADTAWEAASRHAAHVNLRWLPETEATNVRRASVFLAVAADETATLPERAAAASKAAALLAEITSFVLPAEAMRELETTRRLALNPGPTNTASA